MMRKIVIAIFTVASCAMASSTAFAQGGDGCTAGVYRSGDKDAVILAQSKADQTLDYLFLDGRSGKVSDADAPLRCRGDSVMTRSASGAFMVWRKVDLQNS